MNIYAITWNEEYLLPKWYKWYKERFPNASFTIYDNNSIDQTIEIAKNLGVEVISFDTNNQFDDRKHREIKNTCWKGSNSWIITCDLDEFLEINKEDLEREEVLGTTILRFEGFNITKIENEEFYGYRKPDMDKFLCFNTSKISEMNFSYGCHSQFPIGEVKYSKKLYRLLHIKNLPLNLYLKRIESYVNRFEPWNKSVGHGKQYFLDKSKIIENYYRDIENSKIIN